MMQKILLALLLALLPVYVLAAEEDNITDITEKNVYEHGVYKAGEEGNTLTVKKGEGFDFKAASNA